jgi:hypothetical protein
MRRGRSTAPRFPGRDRQRAHRRGNGRSAHPRWRGPRPGKAEAGKRHAPECRRGAQASPAAPQRHRPSFPDRSPPGKKAIPKSPMPSRTRLNEDDTDAGFRKHHTCPCSTDSWDEWDCLCNDRCPTRERRSNPTSTRRSRAARAPLRDKVCNRTAQYCARFVSNAN